MVTIELNYIAFPDTGTKTSCHVTFPAKMHRLIWPCNFSRHRYTGVMCHGAFPVMGTQISHDFSFPVIGALTSHDHITFPVIGTHISNDHVIFSVRRHKFM